MNIDQLSTWIMGALFTVVSGVGLLVLRGILQQGRDTNEKVTDLGQVSARLELSSSSNAAEVARLRDQLESVRADVSRMSGAQELAREIVVAFSDATIERRRRSRRSEEQ